MISADDTSFKTNSVFKQLPHHCAAGGRAVGGSLSGLTAGENDEDDFEIFEADSEGNDSGMDNVPDENDLEDDDSVGEMESDSGEESEGDEDE